MVKAVVPEPGYYVDLRDRDAALTADMSKGGVDFLTAFSAAVERENYVSAWANDMIRQHVWGAAPEPEFETDPDYYWLDDKANDEYEPSMVAEARSAEEAAHIRAQIDRERHQLQMMAGNNVASFLGAAFGGITNPHVLAALPFAGKGVAATVAAEVALESGSEVLLHQMQRTRTMQESVLNVALVGAFTGIVGAATRQKLPPEPVDMDYHEMIGGGSVGSARVNDPGDITARDDDLVGGKAAHIFAVGPMRRLAKSASGTARDIAARIADNPLFNRGHAEGKTRGVSLEALHEAAMGRVVLATDQVAALQKQSGLTREQFENRVGNAMSNGDVDVNPQVQQAAQVYRKEVIDPIQESAARQGLLETDESLSVKIKAVEDDLENLLKQGGGKGSAKALDDLKRQEAAIISKGEKKTKQLEKRVADMEAELAKARKPLLKGDKPRSAPASMIKRWNKARTALSDHKKALNKQAAPLRKEIGNINAHNKRIAKTRKTLREMKARKEKGGNLFALSYFPRIYNANAIRDNWTELENLLINHFKESDMPDYLELDDFRQMATDTITNMIIGRNLSIDKNGKPSALRARVLSLADDKLAPYLQKDATSVMLRHAQAMQPYLMFREAFQGRSMEEMLDEVRDEFANAITNAKGDAKEIKRLQKQMEDNMADLRIMGDRLMHQVQRAIEPRSIVERAMQYSKLYALLNLLGGVVLSSLPDIARPIAHYGLRSFTKGVAKAFAQGFGGTGQTISSIQVKRTGAALQRTLNDRVMQLADSLEPDSRLLQQGHKIWSKATGFGVYTDIMESVASHAAMDYMVRQASKVASGQLLPESAKKQIARMGLTEDDLVEIYHESMRTMGAQDSVLKYMNTMQWKNLDLAKRTEAAIGSDVRRTIIRIGIGDKPRFMDQTTWSWMLQFQTFAMGAQNKILVAGLQNMNRHTAEGLVAMMALGAGVGMSKAWLRGDDPRDWSKEQWAFEAIDRSGMIGVMREPFNALRFAAAYYGITDGVPSRYAGQGAERMLMSPALSQAGRAVLAGKDLIEGDFESAGDRAAKLLPFQNTWHVREVLMKLGEM